MDIAGKEIRVGVPVAWSVKANNTAHLRWGTVVEVAGEHARVACASVRSGGWKRVGSLAVLR